jgi:hypothetical protein
MKLWLSSNSPTPCYLAIHFFLSLHKRFSLSLFNPDNYTCELETWHTNNASVLLCKGFFSYYFCDIPLKSKNDRVSKISIIEIFMLRLESEINYAHCSTSVVDQQTFKSLVWCLRVTKWETSRKWNALALAVPVLTTPLSYQHGSSYPRNKQNL